MTFTTRQTRKRRGGDTRHRGTCCRKSSLWRMEEFGGMSCLLACCVAVAQTGRRTLCTCRSQVPAFKTLVKWVGQRCKYPNPNFLALRTSLEISFSVMNPCFSFTTLFQQFHSFKKEKTNVYNINSFAIFLKAWRSVRQTNIHRWTGTWDGQRG